MIDKSGEIKRLRDALQVIKDECYDKMDVVDGNDGPRPNDWMSIYTICQEALGEVP